MGDPLEPGGGTGGQDEGVAARFRLPFGASPLPHHPYEGVRSQMADEQLTIVFMPESAYGPTNNCVGIGKILEQRGHRVVFAAEASWKGRLEPLGFEEDLWDPGPPPEQEQDAGPFWADFITA